MWVLRVQPSLSSLLWIVLGIILKGRSQSQPPSFYIDLHDVSDTEMDKRCIKELTICRWQCLPPWSVFFPPALAKSQELKEGWDAWGCHDVGSTCSPFRVLVHRADMVMIVTERRKLVCEECLKGEDTDSALSHLAKHKLSWLPLSTPRYTHWSTDYDNRQHIALSSRALGHCFTHLCIYTQWSKHIDEWINGWIGGWMGG